VCVGAAVDTSVERSVKLATRPRLTVAKRRLLVATDASDVYNASAVNSNGRDTWLISGATDAPVASISLAIDATVQRLSPPNFAQ
jgi:hypothetical protein